MKGRIQELGQKRLQYLFHLYETVEGQQQIMVNMWDLGKELGFSKDETRRTVDYLKGEYLLKQVTLERISLTHSGIVRVENSYTELESLMKASVQAENELAVKESRKQAEKPISAEDGMDEQNALRESEIASLRRQLTNKKEHQLLIQERKSEYPLTTDIPLNLISEEQKAKEDIEELKRRIEELEQLPGNKLVEPDKQDEFSPEEKDLLVATARTGEFYLLSVQEIPGDWIRAGGKDFVKEDDPALAAKYLEAFHNLRQRGLVSYNDGSFMLTGSGFEQARKFAEDRRA
jgi:hypothetical protein